MLEDIIVALAISNPFELYYNRHLYDEHQIIHVLHKKCPYILMSLVNRANVLYDLIKLFPTIFDCDLPEQSINCVIDSIKDHMNNNTLLCDEDFIKSSTINSSNGYIHTYLYLPFIYNMLHKHVQTISDDLPITDSMCIEKQQLNIPFTNAKSDIFPYTTNNNCTEITFDNIKYNDLQYFIPYMNDINYIDIFKSIITIYEEQIGFKTSYKEYHGLRHSDVFDYDYKLHSIPSYISHSYNKLLELSSSTVKCDMVDYMVNYIKEHNKKHTHYVYINTFIVYIWEFIKNFSTSYYIMFVSSLYRTNPMVLKCLLMNDSYKLSKNIIDQYMCNITNVKVIKDLKRYRTRHYGLLNKLLDKLVE